MKKKVVFIADSLDNAYKFQQVLSTFGVEIAAGSTVQIKKLPKISGTVSITNTKAYVDDILYSKLSGGTVSNTAANGAVSYQWQYKTGSSTEWKNISGANTTKTGSSVTC